MTRLHEYGHTFFDRVVIGIRLIIVMPGSHAAATISTSKVPKSKPFIRRLTHNVVSGNPTVPTYGLLKSICFWTTQRLKQNP